MAKRDIIVIGGSTGSTEVLKAILRELPEDAPASVFVTTHIPAQGQEYLANVLAWSSALPVVTAEDGALVEPGRVYVAARDRHLMIVEGRIRLGVGPRENMARPAIDPLFRSAALTYGARVIGVILSGRLNDGASGLAAIKNRGGLAVVQNSEDAEAADMPEAALMEVDADHVADAADLGRLLAGLIGGEGPDPGPASDELRLEVEIALGANLGSRRLREIADPAALTCPECQGVLSMVREGRPHRFRCQIGHAYTADVLSRELGDQVEAAMRVALRVMEERAELVDRMRLDALRSGRNGVAEMYGARTQEYRGYADVLRKALLDLMEAIEPTDSEGGRPMQASAGGETR